MLNKSLLLCGGWDPPPDLTGVITVEAQESIVGARRGFYNAGVYQSPVGFVSITNASDGGIVQLLANRTNDPLRFQVIYTKGTRGAPKGFTVRREDTGAIVRGINDSSYTGDNGFYSLESGYEQLWKNSEIGAYIPISIWIEW